VSCTLTFPVRPLPYRASKHLENTDTFMTGANRFFLGKACIKYPVCGVPLGGLARSWGQGVWFFTPLWLVPSLFCKIYFWHFRPLLWQDRSKFTRGKVGESQVVGWGESGLEPGSPAAQQHHIPLCCPQGTNLLKLLRSLHYGGRESSMRCNFRKHMQIEKAPANQENIFIILTADGANAPNTNK